MCSMKSSRVPYRIAAVTTAAAAAFALGGPVASAEPSPSRVQVTVMFRGAAPHAPRALSRHLTAAATVRLTRGRASRRRAALTAAGRKRARALAVVQRQISATSARLARNAQAMRRLGARVRSANPLTGTVTATIDRERVAALRELRGVVRLSVETVQRPVAQLEENQTLGATAMWAAGFTGGWGTADQGRDLRTGQPSTDFADTANVDRPDLQIIYDKIRQDHPAFTGVRFVIPTNATLNPRASDSHGTAVASQAISQGVSSCPAAMTCGPDDVHPDYKGSAPGVDHVLDGAYQPANATNFNEFAWGQGLTAFGVPGVSRPDGAEVLTDSHGGGGINYDDSGEERNRDAVVSTYGATYFQSAGNDGNYSWGVPACIAYNVICVGALADRGTSDLSDDIVDSYSSPGPTVGGRRKPDILAPGDSAYARQTWSDGSGLWDYGTGTSLASPAAAGGALLLLGTGKVYDPLAIKALLIDSARAVPQCTTCSLPTYWDPRSGWGAMDVSAAYAEINNYRTAAVNQDAPRFYAATTQAAGDRATLVWNRRIDESWPDPTNVNQGSTSVVHPLTDLDLYELDATTFAGRGIDHNTTIDNVEQTRSPDAASVIYAVAAKSPVEGLAAEPFALAATRGLTALTTPQPQVTVTTDKTQLKPGQAATVTITATNPSSDLAGAAPTFTLSAGPGVTVSDPSFPNGAPGAFAKKPATGTNPAYTATFTVTATSDAEVRLNAAVTTAVGSVTTTGRAATDITVDGTGPQATATVPASVGSDGRIAFSWELQDPSGVAGAEVQVSADGGPYQPWITGGAKGSATYTGAPGHSYRFRVRGTDGMGNTGPWAETAKVTVPAAEPPPPPPPPPPPTRAAASIKVRSVKLLTGGRLAAAGTLNRKATGRIKITFTARIRGKTVTTAATVKIAKGRFSAKLRLPKLARAFKKAKLAVRYAGNSSVAATTKRLTLRRSGSRVRAR